MVRVPGVDVAVEDVGDVDTGTQGSDGASATGVAVNILDQEVVGVWSVAVWISTSAVAR